MNLEEMRKRKKELGYSNKRISELSGVPLGTVQKIFSGATKSPREDSLRYIWKVLSNHNYTYEIDPSYGVMIAAEDNLAYKYNDDNWISDVVIDSRKRNWRRQGTYTISDYDLLPERYRVELIDGVFYDPEMPLNEDYLALASPMEQHQYISAAVSSILFSYVEANHPTCLVLTSPIDVRLSKEDQTVVQPDIIVSCDRNKWAGIRFTGAPDLIIEILSRSNASIDRGLKLNKYWQAGVREYWIIDPYRREVTVYHFAEGTPPDIFSFEDTVPVGLSDGDLTIDFSIISRRLAELFG